MKAKEFARRRKHLMELIGSSGIAIVVAAPERIRSRDTHFVYRQDSDFFYLTGFLEPEAVAVLVPGRAQGEFLLFCRERNPDREQWDGPRAGPERFGATIPPALWAVNRNNPQARPPTRRESHESFGNG